MWIWGLKDRVVVVTGGAFGNRSGDYARVPGGGGAGGGAEPFVGGGGGV